MLAATAAMLAEFDPSDTGEVVDDRSGFGVYVKNISPAAFLYGVMP